MLNFSEGGHPVFRGSCKYSRLHMSVKHDHEHERKDHMTSRLQPTKKVWRFCPDATLPGHWRAHWWVQTRTPTVHQCFHEGRPWVARQTHHATWQRRQDQGYSVSSLVTNRSSALGRGDLKSKGKGKFSVHFCGDDKRAEVVLHTIISVNQHSIYGAVADMCGELACSKGTGKPVAPDNLETMVIDDIFFNDYVTISSAWVDRRRTRTVGQEFRSVKKTPDCFHTILQYFEFKTTCHYRTTSPSTSTTLEAPTIRTRSFNLDWSRWVKTSRKGDMRCSWRP